MTYMELLDNNDVFFDAVASLNSPEYDQLQDVLIGRLEHEVPQHVIDDLSKIQKEMDTLIVKKHDLLKKVCEAVLKSAI